MPMKIEDCISNWQNSLLDTTKRNRLIKFSHGRAGMFLSERSVKHKCQKANSLRVFKLLDWQKRVELICRSSRQLGQRIPQISPGIDPELLTGGGEARQNS